MAATPNPATWQMIRDRGYPADGSAVYTVRLDEAWRQLQLEMPDVPGRMKPQVDLTLDDAIDGKVATEAVADVVVAAAIRVIRNPEGYTKGSGSVDDYAETWERDDASADVYFTAAERRRLAAPDTVSGQWTGSVKYS